jgi:hypothetical protein
MHDALDLAVVFAAEDLFEKQEDRGFPGGNTKG